MSSIIAYDCNCKLHCDTYDCLCKCHEYPYISDDNQETESMSSNDEDNCKCLMYDSKEDAFYECPSYCKCDCHKVDENTFEISVILPKIL